MANCPECGEAAPDSRRWRTRAQLLPLALGNGVFAFAVLTSVLPLLLPLTLAAAAAVLVDGFRRLHLIRLRRLPAQDRPAAWSEVLGGGVSFACAMLIGLPTLLHVLLS